MYWVKNDKVQAIMSEPDNVVSFNWSVQGKDVRIRAPVCCLSDDVISKLKQDYLIVHIGNNRYNKGTYYLMSSAEYRNYLDEKMKAC